MSSSNLRKSFSLPNERPALMGILNVTPDSFSDGGRYLAFADAVAAGEQMFADGADLVDVGGESTRPGAAPVPLGEELMRTIPVIEALADRGIPTSIDTMKPAVAKAALKAGAFLVNDVSGLRDEAMMAVVMEHKCSVCVMHMQGEPRTMQANPTYGDVVREVRDYLADKADTLRKNGLEREHIWIDPGVGFGKTVAHNLRLLNELETLVETGFPVLIGVSRKSFIGKIAGTEKAPAPMEERYEGTLAAQVAAQMKGCRIIRTHDVAGARRAIDLIAAVLNAPTA